MINSKAKFWDSLSRVFPKTVFWDILYSWTKFVRVHRRIPSRNRLMFNDQLYNSKLLPEILNPLRTYSTDKEYFKRLVEAEVGTQYAVPTLAVFRSNAEIDAFDFPDSFCAKPTHMSGEVAIVRNGTPDRTQMKNWLRMNHYLKSRKRNYKYLIPKVIVESLIFDQEDITDFRIFCYEGKPRLICLDLGKYTNYTRAFLTADWEKQDYSLGYPLHEHDIEKPECLDEMLKVAATLSRELNFVRVDFYTNGKQFYLGELTHAHASASQRFIPASAEERASKTIFGS
ncbi:hypothetical protein N9854_02460 [Amylibacter sp.]|nr:hypothetical protein [Amylibacter sp.]